MGIFFSLLDQKFFLSRYQRFYSVTSPSLSNKNADVMNKRSKGYHGVPKPLLPKDYLLLVPSLNPGNK